MNSGVDKLFCNIKVIWNHFVSLHALWALAKKGFQHAAEIRLPRVEFDHARYMSGTGKVYKGSEWSKKPSVQLGVKHVSRGNLSILDHDLELGDGSSVFGSGRNS
eukprot:s480_g16.t1